jgi:GDP-mannose 6-dehydrogenase
MMRIAVFGLGYVGVTAAACLTKQGCSVCGVDVDSRKVDKVKSGISPIQEPGIDELLAAGVRDNLLTAATSAGGVVDNSDAIMICVGTPSSADGTHNMEHIVNVTREIGAALRTDSIRPVHLIYRSTFRPGTTEGLILPILRSVLGDRRMKNVQVVYNPEFLRESTAVSDYFHPPKIVIGTFEGEPSPTMDRLCTGITAPIFYTRYREAEFTKLIDNTWHATKVAFANEIGRIGTRIGLDLETIHKLFVSDTKLNISPNYLRPGEPFGGSCLPKDVKALQHIAADMGVDARLIGSIVQSNEAHKYFLFRHCARGVRPGSSVLLLGLAFKFGSDDLRESPYVDLARRFLDAGYRLSIYDPYLSPSQLTGQNLGYSAVHLPNLSSLLVSREEVESSEYAAIIDTTGTAAGLKRTAGRLVNLRSLSSLGDDEAGFVDYAAIMDEAGASSGLKRTPRGLSTLHALEGTA